MHMAIPSLKAISPGTDILLRDYETVIQKI